jgi:hypothetical protein
MNLQLLIEGLILKKLINFHLKDVKEGGYSFFYGYLV